MWFKLDSEKFAVVIGEHVFRQDLELTSFMVYFAAFSAFSISWDAVKRVISIAQTWRSHDKAWISSILGWSASQLAVEEPLNLNGGPFADAHE